MDAKKRDLGLQPFGSLSKNLSALLLEIGETDTAALAAAGNGWFRDARASFAPSDKFPSHGAIDNWLSGKAAQRFNIRRLIVLCAYLRFGRYKRELSTNFMQICGELARDLTQCPSHVDFLIDHPLPPSVIPNVYVKTTFNTPAPSKDEISNLIQLAIRAAQASQKEINRVLGYMEEAPTKIGYDLQTMPIKGGHQTTTFDIRVEEAAADIFNEKPNIQFTGEERLKLGRFDGWKERYCILGDTMDGTDMAAMGVNLWCSALVVYDRFRSAIIGSVVGYPSGRLCVAREDCDTAWFTRDFETGVLPKPDSSNQLSGPSSHQEIRTARIGFYGQKATNFLKIAADEKFIALLTHLRETSPDGDSGLRLFNFAGNAQLVKLVDRYIGSETNQRIGGVDAVIEKRGQRPHDFVPGAYIALKMEAALIGLDGYPINEERLAALVRTPSERHAGYVAACSEELAWAVLSQLALIDDAIVPTPIDAS